MANNHKYTILLEPTEINLSLQRLIAGYSDTVTFVSVLNQIIYTDLLTAEKTSYNVMITYAKTKIGGTDILDQVKINKDDAILKISYCNSDGVRQKPLVITKATMVAAGDGAIYDNAEALGLTYMPA